LLWDATGAPKHLDHAVAAGEQLLAASLAAGDGERCWEIPPGFGDLSSTAPLGYAHGAAGIADVLLDLYEATAERRFRLAAQEAGRWLARQAVPALDDGTGLAWPMSPGGEPMPAYWCHGASGIGRFFLHAAALDLLPGAVDLSTGAARAAARGARWAAPTQCHGLSGNIEFLLDAYQASGDAEYLAEARVLGRLLMAFRSEEGGLLRWPSDWPWVFGPDYMVGYAGVALAWLRLADPENRPHGLSRSGFRYLGAAAQMYAESAA
jgi:lantibiotic modifying enzyme